MPISAIERYGPDKSGAEHRAPLRWRVIARSKNQNDGRPCLFLRGRFFLLGEEFYEVA